MDHQERIERKSTYKGACNMGKSAAGSRKVNLLLCSGCENFTLPRFHLHPVLGETKRDVSAWHAIA